MLGIYQMNGNSFEKFVAAIAKNSAQIKPTIQSHDNLNIADEHYGLCEQNISTMCTCQFSSKVWLTLCMQK